MNPLIIALHVRFYAGEQQTPDERDRVESLSRDVALGLVGAVGLPG